MELWFTEKHSPDLGLTLRAIQTLHKERSDYQELLVLETNQYGKVMLLDGVIMLTEKDEFVYHDMLSHVALYTHPAPEKVLIIGGGDGGTLRESIRHKNVDRVTLVEIDEMVINASKKFFPHLASGFKSPKADVKVMDGLLFMKESKEKFDVILIDSTDPVGPAVGLFREEFYRNCYDLLSDQGILVAQSETPFLPDLQKVIRNMSDSLKKMFPEVHLYLASVPTYQTGLWSFMFASKKYHPIKDFQTEIYHSDNLDFRYYNKEIHQAAFALPNFVREIFSG